MKTRSVTRREAAFRLSWTSLPLEIRLIVLEAIAVRKHPGWASLAAVCREWQNIIEKANFHKLKLRVPDLWDFRYIASVEKRAFIHHICLDIELERCSSRPAAGRFGSIVDDGLWRMFTILSTWAPQGKLALELNVYSPSDCERWFKNIYLSSDNVDVEYSDESTNSNANALSDTSRPETSTPPEAAIKELFRPLYITFFEETLPRVAAVTSLIIRRQLRRSILNKNLGRLLRSFNNLEHLSYEPWAPYDELERDLSENGLRDNLGRYLPDTLKTLVVFEDSYDFYRLFPVTRFHDPWLVSLFDPSQSLAALLASKSVNLQYLAVSLMVEAEDFFRRCRSTWSWPHLQSLALTSQLLQNNVGKYPEIETLLYRATQLIQKMPKLHTFVVWNGGKGHACAFVYRTDGKGASITWRGTWHLELSARVIEAWQLVASKSGSPVLQVKQEHVRTVINSHGDAIYYLRLPCQVVEPASLWQIRREACR